MATILTEYAIDGYRAGNDAERNPHIYSSPAYYGWEAGRALNKAGRLMPRKATMGRGYTVNIETSCTQFIARFHGDASFTTVTLDRKN